MARSRKKISHGKEAFYIICILLVSLVGIFSYFGPGGYLEMKKAQIELETHRNRVEILRKTNEERMRTINSLREDSDAIERYAREKGYAKKDEIILEIPSQEPPPAPDPRSGASDPKKKSGKGAEQK